MHALMEAAKAQYTLEQCVQTEVWMTMKSLARGSKHVTATLRHMAF